MNGLDFFFSPSSTVDPPTGITAAEDDDWGDFVDSSPRIDSLSPTPNANSTPNRIESEKKNQAQWVSSRGPLPLSVFGEEEEEEDGSEISGLIANLYRENGHNEITNGREIENGALRSENLSWNPLNLDRETPESTSSAVNSSTNGVNSDPNHSDLRVSDENDDDGWEFKTAESKEEQERAKSGSVRAQDDLSSSVWSSHTNGTGPSFDSGKLDHVNRENGDDDDDDLWGNGGWEFKVAEAGEPKKELTNKESNGWGFGFCLEPVEKEPRKKENGNVNVSSQATSWAFNEPSLETGNEKEEKEVQREKPKGVLPLSFFEDEEELGTSDTLVHEDNTVSVCDFSVREKTKAPNSNVSINDLISSLYSQVDEKTSVNLSEKSDGNGFVNDEDDSWEFQGPSLASKNSDDEFDDDSWEFQGPSQPEGENGSWEYNKHSSVENGVWDQSQENPVISIERNDYKDFFHKLKTELYYIALSHLETLKEARDLAADSHELQKCDIEIQDLQNLMNNDDLISEVNVESLQPRSSGGINELCKALQEPKFRALDSEHLLSERLLSVKAEKDFKPTIELLKHAALTLKILNSSSPEQQSKYVSTWFVIASSCAQELRHAASIWKQVIENDVQEGIVSKPQGKSFVLSVGEIYRVVKILRASTRLYRPWVVLAPTSSSNVLAVLDECVKLWLSSGLEEALRNNINRFQELDGDYSADQLLESIKYIDDVDDFTCITSASSPTCYISGLSSEMVQGIKMVEWSGDQYLVPLANLWANLISCEPPSLPGHSI
ncbi:unnamed protein product [Microthlaspi erraticum]|uniref:Synergin gamma C-terminal domain-containing protein n=1 Tax=Microthlaspi erraticum TaxID=1685480 RepID=A0A6D2IGY1_9BRAS|nr:unnamed protein product [Microthlaspi erraticum]